MVFFGSIHSHIHIQIFILPPDKRYFNIFLACFTFLCPCRPIWLFKLDRPKRRLWGNLVTWQGWWQGPLWERRLGKGRDTPNNTTGHFFLSVTRKREKLSFGLPNTLPNNKVKDVITTKGNISNPLTTNIPLIQKPANWLAYQLNGFYMSGTWSLMS